MLHDNRASRTRSTSLVALIAGGLALTLAGCSSSPSSKSSTSTTTVKPARVIAAPKGLLSGASPQPNGSMWVLAGTPATKTLTQIDLGNGSTVSVVPVSSDASAVAQSSTGTLAVGTATATAGSVELRNGSSGAITSTIAVGDPVRALVFGADGVTLYVLDGNGSSSSITSINTSTGQVLSTVGAPKDAVGVAVDPQQRNVWTVQSSGNLNEVSLSSGKSIDIIALDLPGIAVVFPSSGSVLYTLKGGSAIWNIAAVDTGSGRTLRTLPAAADSVGLAVSLDASNLYDLVGTAAVGNVQQIKLASGA